MKGLKFYSRFAWQLVKFLKDRSGQKVCESDRVKLNELSDARKVGVRKANEKVTMD